MTNQELEQNILKALDEIRPFLNSDGGDISLIAIEESKHVKVRLEGACTSCSLSISKQRLRNMHLKSKRLKMWLK
jgi:Fe-S cluster biogenesis protein NfuA